MTASTPIEVTPADRPIVLRGETIPGGSVWAVLAHDQGEDLDRWGGLPRQLAACGVTVLMFDLRGHGASDGTPDASATERDLEAMIGVARDAGSEVVVVVAGGGTASIAVNCAIADAVVALAPRRTSCGLASARAHARFVVVSDDPEVQATAEQLQREPGRRTLLARVPTADVGLQLLAGTWASNVAGYVVSFIRWIALERSRQPVHTTSTGAGAEA